jgi:2'-5' RNA ligase
VGIVYDIEGGSGDIAMIAYWLIPAEPQRSVLLSLIQELSRKYQAPLFEPHLTLYASDDDETLASALAARIALHERPCDLTISGIEHSINFTQTLFVQFAPSETTRRLSEAFRAGSSSQQSLEFNPHLSLLYARLSPEQQSAEAQRIRFDFDRVTFDALEAVTFSLPIEKREDVEAWRTISKAKLGG